MPKGIKKEPAAKQSSLPQKVAEKEEKVKIDTISSYRNEPTDDSQLFRVVDRSGDWTHYFDENLGYLPAVNHVLRMGFPKGQGLMEWLKKNTPEEADHILKTAGERGSKVHAAIRDLILGVIVDIGSEYKNDDGIYEPLKADEWDCLLAFGAWVEKFQPRLKICETAVKNKTHLYAGTVDFVGSIKLTAGDKIYIDDKLITLQESKEIKVLLDWKTSKAVHDDYRLQVAAYNACFKPEAEYTGVVRFGTAHKNGGFELKLWTKERTQYHFELFLQAKKTYEWIAGITFGKQWEPNIFEIPTRLRVVVPVIKTKQVKKLQKIKEQIKEMV